MNQKNFFLLRSGHLEVTRKVSKLLNPDAKLAAFQLSKEKTIIKSMIHHLAKQQKKSYEIEGDDMHQKYKPRSFTPLESKALDQRQTVNDLWGRQELQKKQLPNRRVFSHQVCVLGPG